jgi:GntR family transcriptional regulator, transcriptional repressor for pyruvate dehydrogenase complex
MSPDRVALIAPRIQEPRRLSLTEQVTQDLLARIEGGELKPGDQLPTERELMLRYHVSRTVVREAISSLRAAGRLATQQGRGAFVLDATVQPLGYRLEQSDVGAAEDALKLMEIRIALESEAASLAAQRREETGVAALARLARDFDGSVERPAESTVHDQAFHLCIADLSGNAYFRTLLTGLSPHLLPRLRVDLFKDDAAAKVLYLRSLQVEHAHILDAIRRGDAEGARGAMRLHLTNSRERLRAALARVEEGG